jgi:hypothetical protein
MNPLIKLEEHDMPRFTDFREDLKMPAGAIEQITKDTRNGTADEFGGRQVEVHRNADSHVYCLLDGPGEDAIRKHHATLDAPRGNIHRVDGLI